MLSAIVICRMVTITEIFWSMMKELWSKVRRRIALRVKAQSLVDLRDVDDDTYFFENRLHFSQSQPIANLRIERGITLPAFRLVGNKCHPFVTALKTLDSDGKNINDLNCLKSAMDDFYAKYQPSNAFDILGIEERCNHVLKSLEPYVLTLPWDDASPKKERRAKRKSIMEENKVLGVNLSADAGWAWSGPVSTQKLDIEARRLLSVYASICENGYQRSGGLDGDIRVNILFDGSSNAATWQSRVGQHRVLALSSLGFEKIPCRISKFVVRAEVEAWPNVSNGLYSKELALSVFDHMFYLGQDKTL